MGRKAASMKFEECPKSLTIDDPFFGLRLDDAQLQFVNTMLDKSVLFCGVDARAGTGKTLLAVATGYLMVKCGMYDNIVYITAPVQEEKLGYLPGDLQSKTAMYMEPLTQALIKLGLNPYTSIIQSGAGQEQGQPGEGFIEATTHVFMRGINLEKKFVIIDESQNFTVRELQKVLTRCHDSSKIVCIGHAGQIDLRKKDDSGFSAYMELFASDDFARMCTLTKNYRGVFATRADEIDEVLKKRKGEDNATQDKDE